MILITGAAGFIGSCMLAQLNEQGKREIVLVDDFLGLTSGRITNTSNIGNW